MKTQADWAYIAAYIEETEAIRQQQLLELQAIRHSTTIIKTKRNTLRVLFTPGVLEPRLAKHIASRA